MKSSMFQIVLLGIFGALAVAGTLIFALLVSGNANNAVGEVTIWGPLSEVAFDTAIKSAAEDDTRFAQVHYVQKDPLTYEQDLTNALAEGTGPDLFLMTQDYVMRDAGKVYQIPYASFAKTQYQDTFIQATEINLGQNGIVALPLLADPLVMFWNRDLVANGGMSKPPSYWDELSAFAQAVVKKDDSGSVKRAAVAFGEYSNVDHAKDILSMLVMQAGGNVTTRTDGGVVPVLSARTANSMSQPGESALLFYTEFADPSKNDYSWNRGMPDARSAFASGDLALYFGYASEASVIQQMNPNLNFAMSAVPQVRGGTTMSTARVYSLASVRTSPHLTGALTVSTLLAAQGLSQSIASSLGMLSARRDVLQASSSPQTMNGLASNSLCSGTDVSVCSVLIARSWIDPNPTKTDTIFRDMIESITAGSARIQDALSRADQQMAQITGQ